MRSRPARGEAGAPDARVERADVAPGGSMFGFDLGLDDAGVGPLGADEETEERALATTIGTDKAEKIASANLQIHSAHHRFGAVVAGCYTLQLQQFHNKKIDLV